MSPGPDIPVRRSGPLVFALALAIVGLSCSRAAFEPIRDASADSRASDVLRDGASVTPDAPLVVCTADAGPPTKGRAEACTCNSECRSGFCVDGVCCETACNERCKACNVPSSLGVCDFVPAGVTPSDSSSCKADPPESCGLDGMCDGRGGCRQYVAGTDCKAGVCDGDGIVGALTCDGKGTCALEKSTPCAPYTCDFETKECAEDCATNSQCSAGQQCALRSCGMKVNGFSCEQDSDCASGHCAEHVCCNVACKSPCLTCTQTGSVGRCQLVGKDIVDSRCPAQGRSSCGTTGACDGAGACAIFPEGTPCEVAECAGSVLLTNARACDGMGTCKAAQLIDCSPYLCVQGACTNACQSDTDCKPGHACVPTLVGGAMVGRCGKRGIGQACTEASECESGHCVDGYCCESGCDGACRSCGLLGSLGRCVDVPAAMSDPRKLCSDTGQTSCGTNGRCDGIGGCQKYAAGSSCGPESCQAGVYVPAPVCNQTGQCVASPSRSCSPYVCNGPSCFASCSSDKQCSEGSFCAGSSCGLKPNGAQCSAATECQSGHCAQGTCCNSDCTGACMACNLLGTPGFCTPVPDGSPDPQELCKSSTSPCGMTGLCKGGACAYADKGLNCKEALCSTLSSATPASSCDGQGTCVTPPDQPCGTFVCSGRACLSTCRADTDCVPPNTCASSSCGLKENGLTCTTGAQCKSGFCTEGVCCNSECADGATGSLCMSCKVSGKVGTCSPVPAGKSDPKQRCVATNAGGGDCSRDGTCDGKGACRPWSSSTGCRQASCSGSTFTPAANCDGDGLCPAAVPQACTPYKCNAQSPSCLTTCTSDDDCVAGTCIKVTNQCGSKLGNGQACKAGADCVSGNCIDEVCCSSACSGLCMACNIKNGSGQIDGVCRQAAAGTAEPHGACGSPSDPATCGNDGKCDANRNCQKWNGTTCTPDRSQCADSTNEVSTSGACNGSGTCAGAPVACNVGYACLSGRCATSCASSSACDTGYGCFNEQCKKEAGQSCTSASQCGSGNCVDGVCCQSIVCGDGICKVCNLPNSDGKIDGTCRNVTAGLAEPHGRCPLTAESSCQTDSRCDGAGACRRWNGTACAPDRSQCADESHEVSTSGTCNGSGLCTPGTPILCPSGQCVAGRCTTACPTDASCDDAG